jgi:serine phosphatase RsbU (regulator of sigma subunit)
MFETTGRGREGSFRRLASEAWRQTSGAVRYASLRVVMFLQGERVDPETLAVTLDGERHLIMGIWSQLAVQTLSFRDESAARVLRAGGGDDMDPGPGSPALSASPPAAIWPSIGYRGTQPLPLTPPTPPAELAAAVELCLSRMLETLAALPASQAYTPVLEPSQFAFTRTLAEFGRREGLGFEDLLADLLLLREALRRHLFRYPMAARVARGLIDPFLDQAAVALAREWSALGAQVAAREAEQASNLLTISSDMLTSLDTTAAFQAVVEQARLTLGVDLAALLMLSPNGDSLELIACAAGEGSLDPQRRLPVADSVSGRAVLTARPFTCLDTATGGVRPVGTLRRQGRTTGSGIAASAVSAPVGTRDGVVGALEVCTTARRIFEPHEADRLALLAGQVALAWEHDSLQRRALEQERAAALREIDLARSVQSALLSRNVLEMGPFRLGARLDPSREVGGDYYDLFSLGDGRAAVHIGDVSGKGIPAALLVAMARYSLRAHATRPGVSPATVLRETNALFCADISEETAMFVTACYAVLEPDPPRLVYASAGHHPPMIRRGNLVQISTAARQAPPLGLARGEEFHDREVHLAPGDVLVFYTDGVIEARNSMGEWFGLTGLERALREHSGLHPDEMAAAIVDAVIAHMSGQPLSDDTTVVVLKVRE